LKFELTASFERDLARLSPSEREVVRDRLPDFVAACDRHAADPASRFPRSLRVKDVEGAPGIFAMAFSFSGPDLRATFEWTRIDGHLAVRWRRIGGHEVFREP
jgi:hypothetical protein